MDKNRIYNFERSLPVDVVRADPKFTASLLVAVTQH
jgi:hypothetical protein